MIAAVQYSAAEIAFGVVIWILAVIFMSWVLQGTLFDRKNRD